MLGCDIRIIDEDDQDITFKGSGEIVGHAGTLMSGYWNREDANQALIWKDEFEGVFIRTGDIGEFDSDGFLTLRGRIKDMIISGGVNVFPVDIETALLEHESVKDASVVGVEHDKWGESPVAFVILKGNQNISPLVLKEEINLRLAKHQRLHAVVFWAGDFPRNTLGKVLKNELSTSFSQA